MAEHDSIELITEKLEFFRRELAKAADAEEKFKLKKLIGELEEQLAAQAPRARSDRIGVSISRLPTPGPVFVGRDAELRLLHQAWSKGRNMVSIVAWGGIGKSALVHRWLGEMAAEGWCGAARIYGWSFYSQGTKERLASADLFVDRALRWFGDPDPTKGSSRDRGLRLADLVRAQRTLLVLDGAEPLQHPPGPLEGRLKDPALTALIKELAAENPGLCIVTTREALADVGALAGVTIDQLDLERLIPEAGAELLGHLGVRGTGRELCAAAEEFGGHALTLTLLGTYLRKACGGEVKQRGDIPLGEVDESGHAGRVMAAYERWLGPGPEVAILRLLALFDRPADAEAIAALRAEPAIPELNEPLVGIGERRWQSALTHLRDCGLLASPEDADGGLDAHPLVRSCFGDRLRRLHPQAWRAGHKRLYDHFCQAAPERPGTLAEMMPLWAAVIHGCRAGKHKAAYDEVYRPRIRRENEAYQLHKLGAFSADLTALAGFFTRTWDQPAPGLTEGNRAWLLNTAGFELRALGRLAEAVGPMRAGLDNYIAQENWKHAAKVAGNLSELLLTLGEVPQAVTTAEESVELADHSGDVRQRMNQRAKRADALHQAGQWQESAAAFREAEAMQANWQSQYPQLYSLRGYRYCDLLLGVVESAPRLWSGLDGTVVSASEAEALRQACRKVVERANQALEIAKRNNWLLDIALEHLSLGLARFGFALAAVPAAEQDQTAEPSGLTLAAEHLDQAVAGLRQAGEEEFVARGLIARATLRRVGGDRWGAIADLDEAEEIAERGGMRLHLCDAHLERARGHLAAGDADDARLHLKQSRALIAETSYHRRDGEVAFLEELLLRPT